jgi:hypothetical protein
MSQYVIRSKFPVNKNLSLICYDECKYQNMFSLKYQIPLWQYGIKASYYINKVQLLGKHLHSVAQTQVITSCTKVCFNNILMSGSWSYKSFCSFSPWNVTQLYSFSIILYYFEYKTHFFFSKIEVHLKFEECTTFYFFFLKPTYSKLIPYVTFPVWFYSESWSTIKWTDILIIPGNLS